MAKMIDEELTMTNARFYPITELLAPSPRKKTWVSSEGFTQEGGNHPSYGTGWVQYDNVSASREIWREWMLAQGANVCPHREYSDVEMQGEALGVLLAKDGNAIMYHQHGLHHVRLACFIPVGPAFAKRQSWCYGSDFHTTFLRALAALHLQTIGGDDE